MRCVSWLERRKLPLFFVAATLLPISVLCWLGRHTLAQERDEAQRSGLELAAGLVAIDIEQDLQRIEAHLADGNGIRFLPEQIISAPAKPLLFRPEVPSVSVLLSAQLFAAAQQEERYPLHAIAAYERIATRRGDADRGEALVALAGLYRRQQRFDEALRVYGDLDLLGDLPVAGGQPAALVARLGRAKIFLEEGNTTRLREEAIAFARALTTGNWLIDRGWFELYQHEIEAWGGPAADVRGVRLAENTAELWHRWRRGELDERGRQLVGAEVPALAVWLGGTAAPVIALLEADDLSARWRPISEARGLTVAVSRPDGQPVFGVAADGLTLSPAQTRLPFMLSVGNLYPLADPYPFRRRVVIGGIALTCLLIVAASYGLYRVTTRELLLARQQSDFVAAVSHEFRTPLTSMRHLLDLLMRRAVTDEGRKEHYYGLLAGETDRLQQMVETLLSFGRIDAGAQIWTLEPLQVGGLITEVADAFRGAFGETPLITQLDAALPTIHGDRHALMRAIWNLLENAAKYSPDRSEVRLFAQRSGGTVVIGVEDHGIGIPVTERRRVFQKFVRGSEAKRAGIRGVGVGLTLVQRIAEAHGGSVRLTSEVGRGSTFMLVLPVAG
jgi:two-component system phosphate regulon sensor histidine kinase PhoR